MINCFKVELQRMLRSTHYWLATAAVWAIILFATYVELHHYYGNTIFDLRSWTHSNVFLSAYTQSAGYYLMYTLPLIVAFVSGGMFKDLEERQLLSMYMARLKKATLLKAQLSALLVALLLLYGVPLFVHFSLLMYVFPTIGGNDMYAVPFYAPLYSANEYTDAIGILQYAHPIQYVGLVLLLFFSLLVGYAVAAFGLMTKLTSRALFVTLYFFMSLFFLDFLLGYFNFNHFTWIYIAIADYVDQVIAGIALVAILIIIGVWLMWKGGQREC